MPTINKVSAVNARGASTVYRTLWRWHFYAGLFCIPFVISLSLTGAIYLFKPQIERWLDRDMQHLEMLGVRSTPEQQVLAARAQLPRATFSSYRLPENDSQAVVISMSEAQRSYLVYVHPYNLNVLKVVDQRWQLISIVRALHGELLLGNVGSVLVELAGCWAIVLIITGLYLWWPRSTSGLAGVLYPRLSKTGRPFWRDIHAVVGFWLAFFTLFLLISGLPWALVWGTAFKELRTLSKPALEQSWRVSHGHHSGLNKQVTAEINALLVAKAQQLHFAPPVEIAIDRQHGDRWKVASQHQNRPLRAEAWFDVASNDLLKVASFSDKSTTDKVIAVGIAAHEGHLFGWLNQLLGLLVTLGLILVSISGVLLWQKRKPTEVLGAPPVPANAELGKVVLIITGLLALLLPVLAMSLLFIFLLEKCVLQHLPATRRWLGLAET